jgi:hypothetical protein
MDKYEYWFLDVAVYMHIGVCWIVPDIRGNLAVNRAPLDLSLPEMAKALDNLFQRGDIFAYSNGIRPEMRDIPFTPNFDEILEALEVGSRSIIDSHGEGYENLFSYGLTKQGGEKWERYSNPTWENLLENSASQIDGYPNWEVTLICLSKDILEEYLEIQTYFSLGFTWIHSGEIKWDIVSSWKYSYWRTFPQAYRVRYLGIEPDREPYWYITPSEYTEEERKADAWLKGLNNWYTNYFNEN